MKKFIAIMIGLVFSLALMAQTSGTTYVLKPNVTSYTAFNNTHTGDWDATTLKDSIGGTAVKYWIFDLAKSKPYYYTIALEYDTVLTVARAAGNHVTVRLSGSIDGSYFVSIDTVLFHPTTMWLPAAQLVSNSPAGVLSNITTASCWRYLKITATGGDAAKCALITKLAIKLGVLY